jgi:hypothetical protein
MQSKKRTSWIHRRLLRVARNAAQNIRELASVASPSATGERHGAESCRTFRAP